MMKRSAVLLFYTLILTGCASLERVGIPGMGSDDTSTASAPREEPSVAQRADTAPAAPATPRIWARAEDGIITHVPSGATCPPRTGDFIFTRLEETIFTDADGNPLTDGICRYQLADGTAQLTTYYYELPGIGALEEMRSTFELLNEDYVINAEREPSQVCQGNLLRLLGLLGVPAPDAACLVFTIDGEEQGALPSIATVTKAGNWAIKVRGTAAPDLDLESVLQDAAFAFTASQVQSISAAAFEG